MLMRLKGILLLTLINCSQLDFIVRDHKKSNAEPAICLFTGEHRDVWSKVITFNHSLSKYHAHLLGLARINRDSLDIIQTSLFTLSLDSNYLPNTIDAFASNDSHMYE